MTTFTVHCEYPLIYRAEVTVEAEDAVSACRTAILSANETDAWKALDWEQRTYVSALAAGADVDPWRAVPDGEDSSVLRSLACSRMWQCSRAMPRPGARIWFSSSAS